MRVRRWLPILCGAVGVAAALTNAVGTELDDAVRADWLRQEARLGRDPAAPDTLRAVAERVGRLLDALERDPAFTQGPALRERYEEVRARLDEVETTGAEAARLDLYFALRDAGRRAALANPLVAGTRLAFMKRRRFVCQMLHEYLGYFYDYGDIAGGGVCVLEEPGTSSRASELVADRLPRGNYTTLALSFDARMLYFAFAPRAPQKPDFYSHERRCFDVYALDLDTAALTRLTQGGEDNFDPCPLPDGGIAFMSTRRGGFGRCHNLWEPLPAYTLHRMSADGTGIRTLSYHETNEWHPQVLNDGRIVYTRWDYVDRSAANFHGLWVSNPDGTNPAILFGNYTMRINACYQPHPVPGSRKIVFVAGAHHADVGGSLLLLDPGRAELDPATGEDDFACLEPLTPEVCFPEAPGWPDSYFHSPWPLSEDFYLVAFSFDRLPGMGPKETRDTETGLYLLDRFGNLELLHREPGISCMYPIPLRPRPVPPVIPSGLDERAAAAGEGEFLLADVNVGHFPLPAGRPIVELRVFQVLPKSRTHVANDPRLGYANAESARLLLGTVSVEPDGSARFTAPAGKPLYFQAVDAAGRAVQTMRSVSYLQPGERRGCIGCHEPRADAPRNAVPRAFTRPPSRIEPGPDGSRPWSFARMLQPVLDRRCVTCHDGTDGPGKSVPALTGGGSGLFSVAYESLRPFVAWYEWGEGIGGNATRPGRCGADASRLAAIIGDADHRDQTGLTDAERRLLYLWLDGNASFYGVYTEPERARQLAGALVPVPALQ